MKDKINVKRLLGLILAISIIGICITMTASSASSTTIINDAFKMDTNGNPIYSQGGGILKVGNTWYWYGVKYAEAPAYYNNPTNKLSTCTFEAFTCYSSTDMVNWRYEGVIADRNTPGLEGEGWVGRCGVVYCAATQKYVLVSQFQGNNGSGILFATCNTPNGAFQYNRIQTEFPMFVNGGTGDQTVFQDDDGQAYLICSSVSGRSNLYVAPLRSPDFCGIDTATRIYRGAGREGNCMFKYNGKYYFCSSDLHGWNASHCYVMEASNILGPYSEEYVMEGSDLSFCHTSQTGFFVTVNGTAGTTVVFCGDRWSDFAGNGLGYNVWCPISFNGSRPYFNDLSQWDFNASAGTWSVAAGNNYIHNAEYEADRVVTSTITGWNNSGSASNLKGKQYSGNFVLQHYDTSNFSAFTNQTVAVPNGTYTLKAWVKSSSGQSTCRLFARNFGGTEIQYNINTSIPSWTQVTVSTGINVTNGSIDIGLYTVGAGGQWAQVDNWSLTRNGGGGSGVTKWQSYNYPTYYIANSSGQGVVMENPSAAASEWIMVPGLADPAGVSFESASQPGYYLRHYNYTIYLQAYDNTAIFRNDATFYKVPGLADSSKVSFQSYNYPTRYLRHYNYQLRIDTISNDLGRSDATFTEIN